MMKRGVVGVVDAKTCGRLGSMPQASGSGWIKEIATYFFFFFFFFFFFQQTRISRPFRVSD